MDFAAGNRYDEAAFSALIRQLADEGTIREPEIVGDVAGDGWCRGRRVVLAASALLPVGGQEVPIRFGLREDFPDSVPEIAVDKDGEFAALPHVGSDGKLCYVSDDEVLLDRGDALGVLRESLDLAAKTLEKGMGSEAASEYVREFISYWRNATPEASLLSAVTVSEDPRWILALAERNSVVALADDERAFAEARPNRSASGLSHIRALYLPIDPLAIDSDFRPGDLVTREGLRKYCLSQLSRNKKLLKEVDRKWKREEYVLLGVRRPEGGRAVVALRFFDVEGGHPIASTTATYEIEPLSVVRLDVGYLLPRGGAELGHSTRKVLIFGCGAVGSQIALGLARSGVGNIVLVDSQRFEAENTYRNALGIVHLGLPKAEALKTEIERLIPHVKVDAHHMSMHEYIKSDPSAIGLFDVVIAATADHNAERGLNELVWSLPQGPAIVHSWLEPYGIGGHVVLSAPRKGSGIRGCLSCLYAKPTAGGQLENRAAFAEHGRTYTRDMMGCGSSMPFGHLDASRTADLACRAALQYLAHGHLGSQLVSWKGDPASFRGAGFTTTPRFEKTAEEILTVQNSFADPQCKVCSK